MSSVIFKAINSYKMIEPKCDIGWIDRFEKALLPDTKRCAEEKGLHLQVLAELLSQTVSETNDNDDFFDEILMKKLNDDSAIESAARKYGIPAYPLGR